jgi:hypothetical protein
MPMPVTPISGRISNFSLPLQVISSHLPTSNLYRKADYRKCSRHFELASLEEPGHLRWRFACK